MFRWTALSIMLFAPAGAYPKDSVVVLTISSYCCFEWVLSTQILSCKMSSQILDATFFSLFLLRYVCFEDSWEVVWLFFLTILYFRFTLFFFFRFFWLFESCVVSFWINGLWARCLHYRVHFSIIFSMRLSHRRSLQFLHSGRLELYL